ncbi:11 kDa late embryogenesis abundant protein-like [Diospyros lotus]|uniref:11 kDa late embryogenesis abundant protein-like n=1 Tax=Diospyros lotus TaxID=55363 RepID=UPI002257B966|nr:11 kDa late embryogenesis abundant protein-like [Diospyros lotus]
MQATRNAAASAKETAANLAASAMAGLEKTKATLQEKVEDAAAQDPVQKEMATEKKEERIKQAEYNKLAAREQNAAGRQAAKAGGMENYSTGGAGAATNAGNNPDWLTGNNPIAGSSTDAAMDQFEHNPGQARLNPTNRGGGPGGGPMPTSGHGTGP